MKRDRMTFEFVEFIPDTLEEGVLYISMTYATAVHKCCSGCGNRVVTPISPTDWTLIFDGDTISLDPSIGNWSLPCKAHYWIRRNRVQWAGPWTQKQIEVGRVQTRRAKETYFKSEGVEKTKSEVSQDKETFWQKLKRRGTRK